MHFEVLSLFPRYIEGPLHESILKRAIHKELIRVSTVDIRSFSTREDGRVDDRPYGGGPGMVMMAEPVVSAVRACKKSSSTVIYLTPRGTPLTPSLAKQLSTKEHLILLCGHYEGIDERAIESCVDLEISVGDYVLTNGCLAALFLIDVVSRFIPGVLGHEESAEHDSFEKGLFDCAHYTYPRVFEGKEVPEVLFSGDHTRIQKWREAEALALTHTRRPDLIAKFFDEHKDSVSDVSLLKVVEPSHRFDETCTFYRKLTGVVPDMKESTAVFPFRGGSLGFMATPTATKEKPLFYIEVTPQQYKKAFSWVSKKECFLESISERSFVCADPDGRSVILSVHI